MTKVQLSKKARELAQRLWKNYSNASIAKMLEGNPEKENILVKIENIRTNERQKGRRFSIPKDEPEEVKSIEKPSKGEKQSKKPSDKKASEATKKVKRHFEGTVINLFKAVINGRPLFKRIAEEETEYIYPLFNHPMSIKMLMGEAGDAKDSIPEIGKDIKFTDLPENLNVSGEISGKFFINVVSTKLHSEKGMGFSLEFKYLGPLNGHTVYEATVDSREVFPEKGEIHTSRFAKEKGLRLHLVPIEQSAQ